jgi:pyrroloquinoline quinone biosynthesis protein D
MDLQTIPKLALGCRLHPTEPTLLIPEGTLTLSDTARDILLSVDGRRTVAEVVDTLLAEYAGADRAMIQDDVLALLDRMAQRGVIRV